jgi:hypothetical protein
VKPEDQQTITAADADSAGTAVKSENRTVPIVVGSEPKRKGRPRKSDINEAANARPYEGLFSAVVNVANPPVIEIQDLRENVTGGEKSWTEPVHCLFCSGEIH